MSAPKPLRSAEEIARGMVGIDRDLDTGAYFTVIFDGEIDASLCLEDNATEAGAEGSARAAESILARLYDRGRADGAAAERASVAPLLRAVRSWSATMSDTGGPAEEQMAADLDLTDAVEVFGTADDAARAGQQPRDLAGRIRALICDYAGRSSDALFLDGDASWIAELLVIELNEARYELVKNGAIPQRWWDEMRAEHGEGPAWTDARRRAADELEVIARECAEKREGE